MENGQGVVSLIVSGGPGDLVCFQSAFRVPHRKIVVIGESKIVRDAVSQRSIGASVEFLPEGTPPLPQSIVIDATKYKSAT